jgi:hypothetical protein
MDLLNMTYLFIIVIFFLFILFKLTIESKTVSDFFTVTFSFYIQRICSARSGGRGQQTWRVLVGLYLEQSLDEQEWHLVLVNFVCSA